MVLGAQAPGRVGRRPFSCEEPREGLFVVDLGARGRRIPGVRRAILVLALVLVPSAAAGGSQVDLVAAGGGIFVVGDAGFRELAAATGRTVWMPTPVDARYDVSVDVADGAAWVA